jgi:hypothetical protein
MVNGKKFGCPIKKTYEKKERFKIVQKDDTMAEWRLV